MNAPSAFARWLALAGLAAALFVVPAASAASTASIKGVGAGETTFGFTEFELSAHVEGDPTTPELGFGQVKIERPTGTLRIDVRCTRVFPGREASITGVVIRSSDPAIAPGRTWFVVAADGGEPGSAGPVDAFFDFPLFVSDPNTFCLVGGFSAAPNVTQGNIVVKN